MVLIRIEADAAGVTDGGVEGAEDKFGALGVNGVADQGVDDLHERGLDGLLVFEERDGMDAGLRRSADASHHALMEVAEVLSAESGRAATDSGDFDMGAGFDAGLNGHIGLFIFLISRS